MPVETPPPSLHPADAVPPPAPHDRASLPDAPATGCSSENVPELPPPYLAAGVLPFCVLGGDLLFLLGQQLRFRSRVRGASALFPKTSAASVSAAVGGANAKGHGSGTNGAVLKSPSHVSTNRRLWMPADGLRKRGARVRRECSRLIPKGGFRVDALRNCRRLFAARLDAIRPLVCLGRR